MVYTSFDKIDRDGQFFLSKRNFSTNFGENIYSDISKRNSGMQPKLCIGYIYHSFYTTKSMGHTKWSIQNTSDKRMHNNEPDDIGRLFT